MICYPGARRYLTTGPVDALARTGCHFGEASMGATQAKLAALQSNLDRDHLLPDRCTTRPGNRDQSRVTFKTIGDVVLRRCAPWRRQ